MIKLLVVQPERTFLAMYVRALDADDRYDLYAADNPTAATHCAAKVAPELIVCGFLAGPSGNDLALVRELRSLNDSAPIIVVSGQGNASTTDIMESGASLAVSRSLSGAEMAGLVASIANALDRKRGLTAPLAS